MMEEFVVQSNEWEEMIIVIRHVRISTKCTVVKTKLVFAAYFAFITMFYRR